MTETACKNPTCSSLRQPQGQTMDEEYHHSKLPASLVSGVARDKEREGGKNRLSAEKGEERTWAEIHLFFHRFLKS